MERGGVVQRHGFTPAARRAAFLYVCVPVRLAMAVAVMYAPPVAAALIVFALACIAVVHNLGARTVVWWSRRTHAFISAVLALASVLVLYDIIPGWALGAVLASDVLIGLGDALVHAPFDNTNQDDSMC